MKSVLAGSLALAFIGPVPPAVAQQLGETITITPQQLQPRKVPLSENSIVTANVKTIGIQLNKSIEAPCLLDTGSAIEPFIRVLENLGIKYHFNVQSNSFDRDMDFNLFIFIQTDYTVDIPDLCTGLMRGYLDARIVSVYQENPLIYTRTRWTNNFDGFYWSAFRSNRDFANSMEGNVNVTANKMAQELAELIQRHRSNYSNFLRTQPR